MINKHLEGQTRYESISSNQINDNILNVGRVKGYKNNMMTQTNYEN